MKRIYGSTILLLLICGSAPAQQSRLSQKAEIKLRSNAEQIDHTLYIQLPKGNVRSAAELPVIVLLDAQDKTLFEYTSATIDRLMYTNDIPEAIFVGVVQADRTKELSVERNDTSALNFQHFLKTELNDYLKKAYHTGDYTTFIGHSLGGQFLTNALTADAAFFRSVVSISGALNYPESYTFYQRKVLTRLQRFLEQKQSARPKQKYYFSAGSEGYQESGFLSGALSADSLFKKYPDKSLSWKFEYLPGLNHMTTPLQSIPAGLLFIFKDWHFSDSLAMNVLVKRNSDPLETIYNKQAEIKDSYGVAIALPFSAYYQFVSFYLESGGNLVNAALLGQDMIKHYPANDESYSLMADILKKQGNKPEALRYYRLAQKKSTPEKYVNEITALTGRK